MAANRFLFVSTMRSRAGKAVATGREVIVVMENDEARHFFSGPNFESAAHKDNEKGRAAAVADVADQYRNLIGADDTMTVIKRPGDILTHYAMATPEDKDNYRVQTMLGGQGGLTHIFEATSNAERHIATNTFALDPTSDAPIVLMMAMGRLKVAAHVGEMIAGNKIGLDGELSSWQADDDWPLTATIRDRYPVAPAHGM